MQVSFITILIFVSSCQLKYTKYLRRTGTKEFLYLVLKYNKEREQFHGV